METAIAGIDWASEEHRLCLVDETGQRLLDRRISHSEEGIAALCRLLREQGVARVALERPDGVLVERLLEAGILVVAIHPNQVKAARERYQVARGKSDGFDAYVLAELCRTDMHRLRAIEPDSDQTKALRILVRSREDLVQTRVSLANQLRAQLERSWPGAARLFADVDSPIALAFLERYPSPQDARNLGEKRLAAFLARNRYSGRRQPSELLERLRSAPRGNTGELEAEAARTAVLALVATLQPLVTQIRLLTSEIAGALHAHPDGKLYRSLFIDPKTVVTAASLLTEIGDSRNRYPTSDALAADAGMSPVAVESGKRKNACFRRACDKRLRNALATLADTSRHQNPWAHDIYQRARDRGCDHPHALRILGRAWTRILWRMWTNHQPYDPTRHGNLQQLLTNQG
jgi:transposase